MGRRFGFVFGMLLSLTATQAFGQQVIGNGGDPLMMAFAQARTDAARMLRLLEVVGIPTSVPASVRDFLLAPTETAEPRYIRMADDVEASHHQWHEGDIDGSKCAVTNDARDRSVVHLSLPHCRSALFATNKPEAEAVRTLIHESCHHFVPCTADEDLATEVGKTIYNLWLAHRRGVRPTWTETALVDAPEPRLHHTSVWTGFTREPKTDSRVIIWGGCNTGGLVDPESCAEYLSTGGVLAVTRDVTGLHFQTEWQPMDVGTAPLGRKHHTAVWTGDSPVEAVARRMIIFGGCRGEDFACDSSFAVSACADGTTTCAEANRDHVIYDPARDLWEPLETAGAPSPRVFHSAVWTEKEMIVWGGLEGYETVSEKPLATGGRLIFSDSEPKGVWRETPVTAETPSPRYGHTALWTGHQLVVWGGCGKPGVFRCQDFRGDGGIFEVPDGEGQGTWTRIEAAPFVEPRMDHAAVFTGRYLIVWGGRNQTHDRMVNGGIYDVVERRWRPMSEAMPHDSRETGRHGHTAVFDGLRGRMIVYGGERTAGLYPKDTLIYDLGDNTWSLAATESDPSGRKGHSALWMEDALLIWGGFGGSGAFLYNGAIFNP